MAAISGMDSGASLATVAQWSLGVIGATGGDRLGEWVPAVDAEDHLTELMDKLTIDSSNASHASESKVFGASTSIASVSGEATNMSSAVELETVENQSRHIISSGYLSSTPLGKRNVNTLVLSAEENIQMDESVVELRKTATSGAEKFGCIGADRHSNPAGKDSETGITGTSSGPETDQHTVPLYNVARKATEVLTEEGKVDDRANVLHRKGDGGGFRGVRESWPHRQRRNLSAQILQLNEIASMALCLHVKTPFS